MAKLKLLAVVAVVAAGAVACAGFARTDDEPPKPPYPNVALPPPLLRLSNDAPPRVLSRDKQHAHKSANFVVYAPTEVLARVMAHEAEHHRKVLAKKWLDHELPAWAKPCTLHYTSALGTTGGTTTFTFGRKDGTPALDTAEMNLRGEFLKVLETVLPHEVTHTVLASHFKRPLPRWADEGIALQAESEQSQAEHDVKARELLNAGRGIRLRALFRMTEYPKDITVLYAQSHSVVRFLLNRHTQIGEKGGTPESRLLKFVEAGSTENTVASWDFAVQNYGFKTVDDLQEAWLDSLRSAPAKPAKGEGDTIPPAKLP